MRRGEEAAKAQWGSLLALKKKIGIAEDYRRIAPKYGGGSAHSVFEAAPPSVRGRNRPENRIPAITTYCHQMQLSTIL